MPSRKSPLFVAKDLFSERYTKAPMAFVAGSVVRGEASHFSDIDLVIVFEHLPNAYRESFFYKDWPVEAYVHDFETIHYFLEIFDRNMGLPELHQMIMEGIVLPKESEDSKKLKSHAEKIFEQGPPQLTDNEMNLRKYRISEILNDLREPRTEQEFFASASSLYDQFGDYYFRSQGYWSARGKAIPKRMKKVSLDFYKQFTHAFAEVFELKRVDQLIALCENFMGHSGGYFEGFREEAPAEWRVKCQK